MVNHNAYFKKINNKQHVFIHAVAGRSSSTAFQRIINSGNTVWIWGEQHGILEQIVSLINLLVEKKETPSVRTSLNAMYHSYNENKHLSFYPNAIGNLDTTIEILNNSISNLLKPSTPKLNRFGFKQITTNRETLDYLKKTFNQSFFIFCFRDPTKQWPSVRASGFWPYSKDLNLFLNEYTNISNIYLDFASTNGLNTFVENIDLNDLVKIKTIISYLNIPRIDYSLINIKISNLNGYITDEEKTIISDSDAYKNYLQMQRISKSFYLDSEKG